MATTSSSPGLFSAPAPIRSLFQSFPLAVHPAEPLPARSPDVDALLPRLYVFAHDADAARGLPSYNPSCLKWQVCFPSLSLSLSNLSILFFLEL